MGKGISQRRSIALLTLVAMVTSSAFAQDPDPQDLACEYGGHIWNNSQSFPSEDGCNQCTCTNGTVVCTEKACLAPCSLDQFAQCFVEFTETTFYLMTAPSQKQLMCSSKSAIKACVDRNLVQCEADFGTIMTAVLRPFVGVFDTISQSFCERDADIDEEEETNIRRAGQCIIDFAKVSVRGSVLATCRQARATLQCIQDATFSCCDHQRNMFSLISSLIENTVASACKPNTCSLGVAEHCINQGYKMLTAPLFRDGGSLISCSWMKLTIDCAFTNSVECVHILSGEEEEEMDEEVSEEEDSDDSESGDSTDSSSNSGQSTSSNADVREYLNFVARMKNKWEEIEGEEWIDVEYGYKESDRKDSSEKLSKQLDSIKDRVRFLVKKLDGKAENDEIRDTLAEFEVEFNDLKNKIENTASGADVQRNMKQLETLQTHLDDFLNRNPEVEAVISDEMKAQFAEMKVYLEEQVTAQTNELRERLQAIHKDLMYLNASLEGFCREPVQVNLTELEPGLNLIVVLGSLLDNPFTDTDVICNLTEKIKLSVPVLQDSNLPPEVISSLNASLQYAEILIGNLCMEPEEPEECIPVEKPEPVCEPFTVVLECMNFMQFVIDLQIAIRDNAFDGVCLTAHEGLECYHHYTDACTEEIPIEARATELRINALVGSHCDYYEPPVECKLPPVCDPYGAVETCFQIPGQYDDKCAFITGEVLPCLQTKLEACRLSEEMTPVQIKLDHYFTQYDPENLCGVDINLLFDDITRPVTNCVIHYIKAFQEAITEQATFGDSLCMAQMEYHECIAPKWPEVNFLQKFLLSRHEEFYQHFWKMNCSHFEEGSVSSETSGDLPDWDGCNVEPAMDAITKFLLVTTRNLGIYYSTEMYAENCRAENYEAVDEALSAGSLVSCSESAVSFFRDGLPFLRDLQQEFCPLDIRPPSGNCSVEEVRNCIKKVSIVTALASPQSDVCSPLHEAFDCISEYSSNCDENSTASIEQEVTYFKGMLGNVECELPSWCSTTGDDGTGNGETLDTEVTGSDASSDSDGILCLPPLTCSLMFESCLKETPQDTCNAVEEVKSCIAAQLSDCTLPQLILMRMKILSYTSSELTLPDCSILPDELETISETEPSCLNELPSLDFTNTTLTCSWVGSYIQCLQSDLLEENPAAYAGTQTAVLNIVKNAYTDFCVRDTGMTAVPEVSLDPSIMTSIDKLFRSVLTFPLYPQADRSDGCSSQNELVEIVQMQIEDGAGNGSRPVVPVFSFITDLIDVLGFCSYNPRPRVCDTQAAMQCLSDLGSEIVSAQKTGFKSAMCSQALLTEMCVETSILGCSTAAKHLIEDTYWTVRSVVIAMCDPPSEPEPSMQCTVEGSAEMECDVPGATRCMFEIYSSLACDSPDWNIVCPMVPFMSACVERHLHGCSSSQKSVLMEIAERVKSKVEVHCPQVTCDVCGAQRCLSQLDGIWEDAEFCSIAVDVQACVTKATMNCDDIHAGQFWLRMTEVNKTIDDVCMGKVHACLNNFKVTAWELLLYSGPFRNPNITVIDSAGSGSATSASGSEDTGSSEESESQDSGSNDATKASKESEDTETQGSKETTTEVEVCDEYYFPDEPWMKNDFIEYLIDIIPDVSGMEETENTESSGSTEGSQGSEESGASGSASEGDSQEDSELGTGSGSIDETEDTGSAAKSRRRRSTKSVKEAAAKSTGSKAATASKDSGDESVSQSTASTEKSTGGSNGKKCAVQRPVTLHPELHNLCVSLYESLSCLQDDLFLLDESIQETLKISLHAVLQIASQKCRAVSTQPLQCHSCHKAASHEECDAQPVQTCPHNKLTCQTVEKTGLKGYVSKGCVNPNSCKEKCTGNGAKCESCCVGHLCNRGSETTPPPPEPEPKCNLYSQTYCALAMASGLVKNKKMDCRLLFQSVECMSTLDEACTTDDLAQMIQVYTKHLSTGTAWMHCLAKERDCHCGANAVLSLNAAYNPYTPMFSTCRHVSAAFNISNNIDWEDCVADDRIYLGTSVSLAVSMVGSHCFKDEGEKEGFCPSVEDDDISICMFECSSDSDCDGDMKCCRQACGGGVCTLPLAEDPNRSVTEKEGFCPLVKKDEFSICLSECSDDSSCKDDQKCCQQACGGGVCTVPLKEEPVEYIPCADGINEVKCFANPCDVAECPNYSNATCRTNYCGSCHAQFYMDDEDVTSMCTDSGETRCELPPSEGPCGIKLKYWFYNATSSRCDGFYYGGCGGNLNRFNTEEQCLTSCMRAEAEEMCTQVQSTLVKTVDKARAVMSMLPQDLICNMLEHQVFPEARGLIGTCGLSATRQQLEEKLNSMLDSDWSVCEEEDSGSSEDSGNEEEITVCKSNMDVRKACTFDIDPTDPDVCTNLQSMIDCIGNQTAGCSVLQLVPLHQDLQKHMAALNASSVTCDLDLPEKSVSVLDPLLNCIQDFVSAFGDELAGSFLKAGDKQNMCEASDALRSCIYGIPNLQLKHQAKIMVDTATKVQQCMCTDVEVEVTEPEETLQCYVCHRENNNTVCNENVETCPFNKQSCQTIVELKAGVTTITKGCKNPTASEAMEKCQTTGSKVFCRYECTESLCNEPLQLLEGSDVEPAGARRKRESLIDLEVTEPDTCKYEDFGSLAKDFMSQFLILSVAHADDYTEFCRNLNTTPSVVAALKTGCSDEMTARIYLISSCFGTLSAYACPQPIPGLNVDEEEEEEEELSCDWQMCFRPILSYFNTIATANCSHINRSLGCLQEKLQKCNNAEKIAVKTTLKMLQNVAPNLMCSAEIDTLICSVGTLDSAEVCDLEQAELCKSTLIPGLLDSEDQRCLKLRNQEACIKHYVQNCPDSAEKTALVDYMSAIQFCETNVTTDWDPYPCEDYFAKTCDVINATDTSQAFFGANTTGPDCLTVNSEGENVQAPLFGCSPLPVSIVEAGWIRGNGLIGASCEISFTVSLESHSWTDCVSNFVKQLNLQNICSNLTTLLTCMRSTRPASDLDTEILAQHLKALVSFTDACSIPDGGEPTGPECNTQMEAQCMLSYGTLFFFGPFLPLEQKSKMCKSYESKMTECRSYSTGDCPSPAVTLLQNFFDSVYNRSGMCSDSGNPIWPEEPETPVMLDPEPPKCRPDLAMTYISELGISLSKCISSVMLKDKVCRSVRFIEMQVHSVIDECPELVQHQVLWSWTQAQDLIKLVCEVDVTPDPEEPDNTPVCVPKGYSNPEGRCQPSRALACLARLENEVFLSKGTEKRFCVMVRHTVMCFVDYTTNCDPFLAQIVNPLMHRIFTEFSGRCPDTWCPVEGVPGVCDITEAQQCVTTWKMSVKEEKDEACLNFDKTKQCISRATVDCAGAKRLLVKEITESLDAFSKIVCTKTEPPPIDPLACIDDYKALAFELLEVGTAPSSGMIEGGSSLDNVTTAGNSTTDGSLGGEQNSTASQASDGSLVVLDSREYQDTVMEICDRLETAWTCVEETLNSLGPKHRLVVLKMLSGIRQAVVEKCQPMHCYSCTGLDDNDGCNAQQTYACFSNQQMCYIAYEDGKYTKGCAAQNCAECEGKESCECCQGHKCNKGPLEEPEVCHVGPALECAFSLVTATINAEELSISIISSNIQCIINQTAGCQAAHFHGLYTICVEIKDTFTRGECIGAYGDPFCGTPGILALGYIMQNPYQWKTSICRQYQATGIAVENVYGVDLCSDSDITQLQDAYTYASNQMNGYCEIPEGIEVQKCDVNLAVSKCVEEKTWLAQDTSVCSDDMFEAFKQCCISYTGGCNSAERAVLFIPATQHLHMASLTCEDDFETDLDALIAEIFVVDNLSIITNTYMSFVQHIQSSLTIGSLNFIEDLCSYASNLTSELKSFELSPLLKVYSGQNVERIMGQLEDVCANTEVSEEEVVEECKQVELDIALVLDSSGSIGEDNFELVRQFADNVIRLADVESGSVHIGVLQFASVVTPLFYLNDYMTDGVQDKTSMLNTIANMTYTKGKTNTAAAISSAANIFLSTAKGARDGVPKHILVVTDGESTVDPEDTIPAANNAKAMGIKLFAVGIKMEKENQILELEGIASSPAELNVLRLQEFDELDVVYRKIFRLFCRTNMQSDCDFVDIVYKSVGALMYSMTSSYAAVGDKSQVCSKLETLSESVTALSASCARYQQSAIQLVQSLTHAQSQETCLVYRTDVYDPTCDLSKAKLCITDMAQFLRSASRDDGMTCRKVASTMECLNYYAPNCPNKQPLLDELAVARSIIQHRCPDQLLALQCWSTDEFAGTTASSTEEEQSESCDLVSVVTDCVKDIDWTDFNILSSPCTTLMEKAQGAMTCAVNAFVSASCSPELLKDLTNMFLGEDTEIYSYLSLGGTCVVPSEFDVSLPDGYGEREQLNCEMVEMCDTESAMTCLADLQTDGDGCRNWAEVKTCVLDSIVGCNDINYLMTMSGVRLAVLASGLPESCTTDTAWEHEGESAFINTCLANLEAAIENMESACDALGEFIECLDGLEQPGFVMALYSRVNPMMTNLLSAYCSIEIEFTEPEVDLEECVVSESERQCVQRYARGAVSSLFLGQAGKKHFCNMPLDCMERRTNCSRTQPYGGLWEMYNLLQAYANAADTCAEEPIICSEQSAMNCISQLGEAVTLHDYTQSDDQNVCYMLNHTRQCLTLTLRDCTREMQTSIIKTFHEVECLALDVCTSGKMEPPSVDEEPAECVDPDIAASDASCNPESAKRCMREFVMVATDPFAEDNKAACVAYSDMLQCVFDNSVDCSDVEERLISKLLNTTVLVARTMECPTEIRSPCEEVDDCGLSRAKTCIETFYSDLESFRASDTVCTQIDAVRACIDASLSTCSKTAVAELDVLFNTMVQTASVDCTANFLTCATKYVHYVNKILTWKAYIEPEEAEAAEETAESAETASKASKEKSASTGKTASQASAVTPVEETTTPEERFLMRVEELSIMCQEFSVAWTCVQEEWNYLEDPALVLVQSTFTAYHPSIMEICNGPKEGYCVLKKDSSLSVDDCATDMECADEKKCCAVGTGHICTKPKPHKPECWDSLVLGTHTAFTVMQALYLKKDKGTTFCSLYAEKELASFVGFGLEDCPWKYKECLWMTWKALKESHTLYCVAPPEPPATCVREDAQACVDTYNSNDIGKTNNEKCSLLETLKSCLEPILTECDEGVAEEAKVITDMNAEVRKIENSLTCAEMPGVKVSVTTPTIVIVEGNIPGANIDIKLTGNPADICAPSQVCSVKITYELTENKKKMPKCSKKDEPIGQVLVGNLCEMTFTSASWNITQTVTLTARLDMKVDGDFIAKFALTATFVIDTVDVLSKKIKDYSVVVVDGDTKSQCTSWNDPHIRTFDNLRYDNFHQGEFVFYRHLVYPFEVRTYHTSCTFGKKQAACNCGVCVLAGDDTFCINRCYGRRERKKTRPTMWQNGELMDGLSIYESKDGLKYTVILPIGTRVIISLEKGSKRLRSEDGVDLLNVFIVPSPVDKGQTTGLCGNYDGDPANDVQGPDGTVYTDIDLDLKSGEPWHLLWSTTDPMDFIFEGVPASTDSFIFDGFCRKESVLGCVCDHSDFVETCDLIKGEDVTLDIQTGPIGKRRKRDVGDPLGGMSIDLQALPEPAVFPTASGITYEQANETCYNALTGASFADICSNILPPADITSKLENCIEDIKHVDDLNTDFIETAKNAFSTECQNVAQADTNTTLINEIQSVTCPNECSQHGTCTNGTCDCDLGYLAADCSIDISVPPVLEQLGDNRCESTIDGTCDSVQVFGEDFVNGSAVCHLERVKLTESGIDRTSSTKFTVSARWRSLEEVSCDLTQSGTLPLHTVLVSVSNNGQETGMSVQHLFIAHNPICFICALQDPVNGVYMNGTCSKRRASCYVDGICYSALEPSVADPCYLCDVYTENMIYQVSDNCPPLTTTEHPYKENLKAREMNDQAVIGISAGAAGLLLVIVIIVLAVLLHKMRKSRHDSDKRNLTHRPRSKSDSEESGEFVEVAYPAFSNHGYQGYPAIYSDPPQELFVNGIPKRHSSSRTSDPTRDTHEWREDRKSNRHSADVYIHNSPS